MTENDKTTSIVYKDAESAQKDCIHWQRLLKLSDWQVIVKISRASEFRSPGRMGEVLYTLSKKSAIIRLLDPNDYSNVDFPQDHVMTLVHELSHLHLCFADSYIDSHPALDTLLEQAIEAFSSAVVS